MQEKQRVSDMVAEVLARQARTRSKRTGESFEEVLEAVLETEAGRKLKELSEGPHSTQSAQQWQQDLPHKRAKERKQTRLVTWEAFMEAERRELELRKNGQLARVLGERLPGEAISMVARLVSEDRRQAEEELVALMRDGEVFYKHLEELSEGDMPARIAARRLRTMWLKERQEDRWFGHDETG